MVILSSNKGTDKYKLSEPRPWKTTQKIILKLWWITLLIKPLAPASQGKCQSASEKA